MLSPFLLAAPSRRSTVVPGQLPMRWRAPVIALKSVDLPELGFPASAILRASATAAMRLPARTRQARRAGLDPPHLDLQRFVASKRQPRPAPLDDQTAREPGGGSQDPNQGARGDAMHRQPKPEIPPAPAG